MAYDANSALYLSALKSAVSRIDTRLDGDESTLASAIKSVGVSGNTVSFFTAADGSGAAAFTVDFPKELFLDQAKTSFVDSFTWSEETYPGSTDPSLDGKPVFVLAVSGSDDSVSYSFVNMAALVDTYKAKTEGKDATTTVTISGYEVDVAVNLSTDAGNALVLGSDGKLYVATPEEVAEATATAAGLMSAADKAKLDGIAAESTKVAGNADTTNGTILVDGTETTVVKFATEAEVTEMLDEVLGVQE